MKEKITISFRVDKEMYEKIKAEAEREGRSISSWIRWTLKKILDKAQA